MFAAEIQFNSLIETPKDFLDLLRRILPMTSVKSSTLHSSQLAGQWCLTLHLVQISRSLFFDGGRSMIYPHSPDLLAPRPLAIAHNMWMSDPNTMWGYGGRFAVDKLSRLDSTLSFFCVSTGSLTLIWQIFFFTMHYKPYLVYLKSKFYLYSPTNIYYTHTDKHRAPSPLIHNMCQTWCRGHGFSCKNTCANWDMYHTSFTCAENTQKQWLYQTEALRQLHCLTYFLN